MKIKKETEFQKRLASCYDELKWLYCELYHNDIDAFSYFCTMLQNSWQARKADLRRLDARREMHSDWYRSNRLLGMMMYTSRFAGNLKGVREKLSYIEDCGVNYLHLMPLLDSPKGKSDGGYAVSDFRRIRPDLGTMEDLEALADDCRKKSISLALDFVMNHTSDEHEWARKARQGDPVCRSRYFFYDNWDIPNEFEKTVPQVFPTTAPGSFTWLEDCRQVVMTSFYPYQWDLNYANPMVFNDMTENLLYLANRGIDVIRLDAVPYIWKQLGTDCRNLPQVHTLVRMLRLACQVVCPGVLLLGEVVMEPQKVAPYFGTINKPECQVLYNVTTMCTTWHTLATRDVRLLQQQMQQLIRLPKSCLFQNYLRCHDDIGWGLDYGYLSRFGISEPTHKQYLNDWFTGKYPGSSARGELYNDDPRLRDARLCGTTASLVGLETAKTDEEVSRVLSCHVMLHAWMLTQSGIPVLYSGDELAQLNDYSYHESNDPDIRSDSRYLHRGNFHWEKAERRQDLTQPEGIVFCLLKKLTAIRAAEGVFHADADVEILDIGNTAVLGVRRSRKGEHLTALFNFSEQPQKITLTTDCTDLLAGLRVSAGMRTLPPYAFFWLKETGLQEEAK